jgi:predicted TIM-barrel fold metal-dependent hydrolase
MSEKQNEDSIGWALSEKELIDVHCHLFNAKYAIRELAAATWNYIWGDYPHQRDRIASRRVSRNVVSALQGVEGFAVWIARLIEAALSDCAGNYETSIEKFTKSSLGKGNSLVVVPLMMDVYFALDDNGYEENEVRSGRRAAPIIEPFDIPENQRDSFGEHLEYIKGIVKKEMKKLPSKPGRRSVSTSEIDSIFEDVRAEMVNTSKGLRRDIGYRGIELSPGYRKHMQDLEELSEKYPDRVIPFLAVDPRRKGIMDLIEMKVNGGKGAFKGIKLYPPLGYLPTHPELDPVFEYCVKYDVPITVHCSEGGLPNFRGRNYVRSLVGGDHWEEFNGLTDKSTYYADPGKWIPVLAKWKTLRINFAHFGGGQFQQDKKEGDRWSDAIIRMMRKYPNVYADVSYFTDKDSISQIKNIMEENKEVDEILKTRLMFGTDFVMIMLDYKLGGLENYFNNFYEKLDGNMFNENARKFLKL